MKHNTHTALGTRLAALLLPALVGAGLLTGTGIAGHRSIDKVAMAEEQKIPEEEMLSLLDHLSRLAANAGRTIEEYDTSDESPDTLLWSKERTEKELVRMISRELERRELWRATTDLSGLRYQWQVRRWRLGVPSEGNGYSLLAELMEQLADKGFDALRELHLRELGQALKAGYSDQALSMLEWEARRSEENIYPTYIERFAGRPEQPVVRMLDLRERSSRLLEPLRSERKTEEWLREEGKLYAEYLRIEPSIPGNPYKKRLREMGKQLFGHSPSIGDLTYIDLHTGEATVEIEGPTRQALDLYLISSDRKVEQQIRNGRATKLASYTAPAGKARWISDKVSLRLPRVGYYKLALYNERQGVVRQGNALLDKITVDQYDPIIYALDRQDGSPVSGVEVKVFRGDERRRPIATLYTGEGGEVVVRQTPPRGGYLFISVKDPRMLEERFFTIYGAQKWPAGPAEPKRQTETHFYTDRPIYRRGQTVKVGIVTVTRKGEVVKAEPNTLQKVKLTALRDGVEEVIETQTITTDDHGVAETTFTLPKDEHLSDFTLDTPYGDESLRVEDYKLMHLSLTIDSIPTGYVSGRPMRIYGRTEDLNGHPVAARLTLQYDVDGKRMTGRSGSDGHFVLETEPLTKSATAGYYWNHPLTLSAADAIGDVADESLAMEKDTTNLPLSANLLLGGKHILNRLDLTLSTESQPYQRMRLGDLSRYQLTATWIDAKGKQVGEPIDLPMKGKRNLSLASLPSGSYRLRIETTDYWGQVVTDESDPLYLYSPTDDRLVGEVPLFATMTKEGEILYGSSHGGTLSLLMVREGKGSVHRFLPVEPGKLYRLRPMEGTLSVVLSAYYRGEETSRRIDLTEYGEESGDKEKTHTAGLEMKEGEGRFVPGADFSRRFTIVSRAGKPLSEVPVLVAVFDKALTEASGNEQHWSKIGDSPVLYQGLGCNLYGAVLMESAVASPRAMMKQSSVVNDEVVVVAEGAGSDGQPRLRQNFAETAYFSALLRSNRQGQVQLDFKLPDTQTEYVLKVYSFAPDFEEELLEDHSFSVFAPLSVELSLPRYLRWGDRLEGLARVQNAEQSPATIRTTVTEGQAQLSEAELSVAGGQTGTMPFVVEAKRTDGDSLILRATAAGAHYTDALERVIPLRSDLAEYTVAVPFSSYKQSQVSLTLPKADLGGSQAVAEIYFSPIHLLLTTLADTYATEAPAEELSLLEASTKYAVYSRLKALIASTPELKRSLSMSRTQLLAAIRDRESEPRSSFNRQTDPRTLADFYDLLLSEERMSDLLGRLEKRILAFTFPTGGFRYDALLPEPSPWLTHVVLENLAFTPTRSAKLDDAIDQSLKYLQGQLSKERSYYKTAMEYRLLTHKLGRKDPTLTREVKQLLEKQVKGARESYRTASTSYLLNFGEYSRAFDTKAAYSEVRDFIRDRSSYTESDAELLALILFLHHDQQDEALSPEVTRFMLSLKQGTLWRNPMTLEAVEPLLRTVTPTRFAPDAMLHLGEVTYRPTALDKATGHVVLGLPEPESKMVIRWEGVTTDFAFGGIRYRVTEPAAKATPTGEKLTIGKEVYARRIIDGQSSLVRLTDEREAVAGEQLVVRYLIETKQDLSLVTIRDDRAAGAEPGYDFAGYGMSDRTWYGYSRRETADYIFIDYLQRGKHVIELEATANVAGHFSYGPAEVQSFYAPEYAGNSAGGSLTIRRGE